MLQRLRDNKILTVAMALGLVCALILCGVRFSMELGNTHVAFCMPDEDIALLAEAEGMDFEVYKAMLLEAGLTDGLDEHAAVWLVEDDVAYSYLPIEGFVPDYEAPMVRAFRLRPEWGERYGLSYIGYAGPEEIENLTYRAITDRNVRVVQFTVFRDYGTKELISDPDIYVQVFESLGQRIARHGLTLGDSYSVFEPYKPAPALLGITAFGVCAAGIFLLVCLFELKKKWQYILLWLSAIGCPVAFLLMERFAIQVFALGTAIVFPCISLWYLARGLTLVKADGLGREISAYLKLLWGSAAISVVGGLFVGALQCSTFFLLAIENFRGVKVSQALPVVFAAFIVLRAFYGRQGVKGILQELRSGGKFLILLVLLVLALGIVYFLARTGDGILDAGALEQRFRNWLENLLLVRPRTKEFLAAWPCLAAALLLVNRGGKRYAWPFAILSAVGPASVINTFCHSRSPLWLSGLRTVYGLILGGAIGILLLCLTCGLRRKQE